MKLEHINLRVPSIRKTQEFLALAFPDFRQRGSGYGPTYGYWSHFGNDDTYIALLQADKPGEEDNESIPDYHYEDRFRLMHVGITVDSVAELMQRLAQAGLQPNSSDDLDSHPARRRIYYLDGNGVEWEFVEYLSEDPEQRNDYTL